MKPDKILSLVGLATRAGKTASGEFCTEKEVKTGSAAACYCGRRCFRKYKEKFRDMCEFYEVPIYFYKDKDTLGHAMGKEFRAISCNTGRRFCEGNYEADEDRR